MNPDTLATSHQAGLVALSFLISAFGAYTALAAAAAAAERSRPGRLDRFNIGLAGLALGGIAIWSMHYTGMAAATVVCTSRAPNSLLAQLLRPTDLPVPVIAVAGCIALIIGLDLWMQRMIRQRKVTSRA